MFFLQKKLWIAWSKLRFLGLPIEKRVRLEMTVDGRHITFLLTALGEAGYGVHVVGAPFVLRELICSRKSVPMPFVIGGDERECGIWITDRPSTLDSGLSTIFVLDYDYFSGLTTNGIKAHESEAEDLTTENTEGTIEHRGRCEKEQPEVGLKGEEAGATESKLVAGQRLAGQSGAEFSNPFTIELAQDSENTSPTRSANGHALAATPPMADGGGLMAEGSKLVPSSATGNALDAGCLSLDPSSLATRHSSLATALRAPYFMHPSVYHKGLHRKLSTTRHSLPVTRHSAEGTLVSHSPLVTSYPLQRRRRFRIGFFGTHDREFYTKYYHFPGMNRFEVLEVFLQKFGDRITRLQGGPKDWDLCEIAVSIDSRGGDRKEKNFLSQEHYFEALRECDFVLSPPGWCMPVSHNLIEAMFCGAIPITNSGAFMAQPLEDGQTCLEFQDVEGLVAVIERALAMDECKVEQVRNSVRDYYDRFLAPRAFGEGVGRSDGGRVFVNAEENSVRLFFPGMVFPWDDPAGALGRRGRRAEGRDAPEDWRSEIADRA